MNEALKEEVKLKILQLIKGQTLEKNKFDIKAKWYQLDSKTKKETTGKEIRNRDFYEFLKDCTSIINSYGREDGFIVIGIDEENNCINTQIKESGLDDPSKIKDIIIGNIDKAFLIDIDYIEIEGKQLSVIHIPPSTDKPHLIKEYWSKTNHKSENVIFLRNGTGAVIAGKGDIDRMYWERNNIILNKKIEIALDLNKLKFSGYSRGIILRGKISAENVGSRKISVTKFELNVNIGNTKPWKFYSDTFYNNPLSLLPNDPQEVTIDFDHFMNMDIAHITKTADNLEYDKKNLKFESIVATLTNHEKLLSIPLMREK